MRKETSGIWLYALFVFTFFVLSGAVSDIAAEDLIVDGTTLVLHGEVEYESVMIVNGGVIYVTPFDGTGDTGMLILNADNIFIDTTSSINADGAGYRGIENGSGEGPGGGEGGAAVWDGGGGGGYGGKGGNGVRDYWYGNVIDGIGGSSYGDPESMSILMGSAGGSGGTRDGDYGGFGGPGGGAVILEANTIQIAGTVTANGNGGYIYRNDASGGGSGGGILIIGGNIILNGGLLCANGGGGGTVGGALDDGGGGGSGGRVKVFYRTELDVEEDNISIAGGNGSYNGEDGEAGSYYQEKIIVDAAIEIKPDTLNLKNNGKVITAYIELSGGLEVADILVSTILLNGCVPAESHPAAIGDHDYDNIPDLMVKFSRSAVQDILVVGEAVQIVISGELSDGTAFSGSDGIRVISKGKK